MAFPSRRWSWQYKTTVVGKEQYDEYTNRKPEEADRKSGENASQQSVAQRLQESASRLGIQRSQPGSSGNESGAGRSGRAGSLQKQEDTKQCAPVEKGRVVNRPQTRYELS